MGSKRRSPKDTGGETPTAEEVEAWFAEQKRLGRLEPLTSMFATEVGIILGKAVDLLPDGHPLKARIMRLPEYFARAIEGTLELGEEQAIAAEMTEVVTAAWKLIQ